MDELTTVIKEALENRGVLNDLRGALRSEVNTTFLVLYEYFAQTPRR